MKRRVLGVSWMAFVGLFTAVALVAKRIFVRTVSVAVLGGSGWTETSVDYPLALMFFLACGLAPGLAYIAWPRLREILRTPDGTCVQSNYFRLQESGVGGLLGVDRKPFRWQALLWFIASLAVATVISLNLQMITHRLLADRPAFSPGILGLFRMYFFALLRSVDPQAWLDPLVQSVLFVGLGTVLVRFAVRRNTAILLAAALGTLVTPVLVVWLLVGDMGSPIGLLDLREYVDRLLTTATLEPVVCVGASVLVLRRVKLVWRAFAIGAAAGALLPGLLAGVLLNDWWPPFVWAARLAQTLAFVGLLGLGLRLTREEPSERSPRLPRGFYLGTLGALNGLAIYLAFAVINSWGNAARFSLFIAPRIAVTAVFVAAAVCATLVLMRLIYRSWAAIQDGHSRTTPARAVGFLFIPVFNVYWAFRAFPGFAKELNAFALRHGRADVQLSPVLFRAYVLLCLAPLPFYLLARAIGSPFLYYRVMTIGMWCWLFVLLAMVSRTCDAVNRLPEVAPNDG